MVIDPKPWIGDPAFDLAQLLVNWVRIEPASGEAAVAITLRRAEQLANHLSLDVRRVLRWAVVKAVAWHADREHALTLEAAALRHGD